MCLRRADVRMLGELDAAPRWTCRSPTKRASPSKTPATKNGYHSTINGSASRGIATTVALAADHIMLVNNRRSAVALRKRRCSHAARRRGLARITDGASNASRPRRRVLLDRGRAAGRSIRVWSRGGATKSKDHGRACAQMAAGSDQPGRQRHGLTPLTRQDEGGRRVLLACGHRDRPAIAGSPPSPCADPSEAAPSLNRSARFARRDLARAVARELEARRCAPTRPRSASCCCAPTVGAGVLEHDDFLERPMATG